MRYLRTDKLLDRNGKLVAVEVYDVDRKEDV